MPTKPERVPKHRMSLKGRQVPKFYPAVRDYRDRTIMVVGLSATVVPEPVIPRPTESTALVRVAVRQDDFDVFGPGISFSAPGGYRIEGLTLDQAIGLLRLFG